MNGTDQEMMDVSQLPQADSTPSSGYRAAGGTVNGVSNDSFGTTVAVAGAQQQLEQFGHGQHAFELANSQKQKSKIVSSNAKM